MMHESLNLIMIHSLQTPCQKGIGENLLRDLRLHHASQDRAVRYVVRSRPLGGNLLPRDDKNKAARDEQ